MNRVLKAGFLFALVTLLRSAEVHSTQAGPAASVWDRLYYFHAQADRTVWDGVYVDPQADRGEVNFFNHCASCHQGGGEGPILSGEKFFDHLTKEDMMQFTREGGGTKVPRDKLYYKVDILDVYEDVAIVRVETYPYFDYLQLLKDNGRWWIVNVLWTANRANVKG